MIARPDPHGAVFSIGAGFDAAGQLVQNGAIRPEQSLIAGGTAAAFLAMAARGNLWIPAAGASTSAINTTFNNIYYGESTSVLAAGGYGAAFGAAGPLAGTFVQRWSTPFITNAPRIPINGSAYIPSTAPRLENVPGYVGNTVNNTVGNIPSFIRLDDGKSKQVVKP